jgi:hypothetical protein
MSSPRPRIELYTPVHKALRRRLFDVATLVARTDFAVAAAATEAAAACAATLELTREHALLEDRHLQPQLERLAPALATSLAAEHEALERAADVVEALLPLVAGGDEGSRLSLGAELLRRVNLMVAEQLRHMDREEREAAPVLAGLGDAALAALIARLRADVAPARRPTWAALFAGALSARELASLSAS